MSKPGPKPRTYEEVVEHVLNRLGPEPSDPDACWEWPDSKTSRGYGQIQARGLSKSPLYVHRIVHKLRDPSLTDDDELLHACDNPPCARHTVKGTHKQNMHDAIQKGRLKLGGRTGGTWVAGGGRVRDAKDPLSAEEVHRSDPGTDRVVQPHL